MPRPSPAPLTPLVPPANPYSYLPTKTLKQRLAIRTPNTPITRTRICRGRAHYKRKTARRSQTTRTKTPTRARRGKSKVTETSRKGAKTIPTKTRARGK
mmetsp:Transcript_29118/g.5269  ORF Transcript_29118/g.5269 Transcript_29118/m.5269 type:complete len:99 (-) Transcript_29118:695-991(-)